MTSPEVKCYGKQTLQAEATTTRNFSTRSYHDKESYGQRGKIWTTLLVGGLWPEVFVARVGLWPIGLVVVDNAGGDMQH